MSSTLLRSTRDTPHPAAHDLRAGLEAEPQALRDDDPNLLIVRSTRVTAEALQKQMGDAQARDEAELDGLLGHRKCAGDDRLAACATEPVNDRAADSDCQKNGEDKFVAHENFRRQKREWYTVPAPRVIDFSDDFASCDESDNSCNEFGNIEHQSR
mgnify:CR=1 FL=1